MDVFKEVKKMNITDQLRRKLRTEPVSFIGILVTIMFAGYQFLSPSQVIITSTGEEIAGTAYLDPIILLFAFVALALFAIIFIKK